jgi:esterase/lipase superfamily enzyme
VLLAAAAVLAGGCGRTLMPTPNLYAAALEDPFADVPPGRRTPQIDLLYVTDRKPEPLRDGSLRYGYERSASLAYGSCTVNLGSAITWEELVKESRARKRSRSIGLSLGEVREEGRLAPTPTRMVRDGDRIVEDPEAVRQREELVAKFHAEIDRRLAQTTRKEAYVFVHGYNNTFEDAAFALAELWHFLGREGIPILYTWPAGSPGLLRGYTHDRESGEFTIFHLKQLFRGLAIHPGIERLHVIAHSRGTDVCCSALRELFIEARSAGRDPREVYQIANLLLAAPDLDYEVVTQRLSAERFGLAVNRFTMYVSENDKAIGIADWLFSSRRRLGHLREEDVDPVTWENLEIYPKAAVIDARFHSADPNRHSYFRTNPSVSSDVILVLRYGRDPGAENGRPLEKARLGYWILEEGYPGGGSKAKK